MSRRHFALILLAASVGCGKVADPRPPYIRIPEGVKDLSASQNGYNIILTWTNPARNIDESTAMDLAKVRITSDGSTLSEVAAGAAGQAQGQTIPARQWVGQSRQLTVVVETTRGRLSAAASVSIQPVDVPSAVQGLSAIVDQRTIAVEWRAPATNAGLASGYLIHRADDKTPPHLVREPRWVDRTYDAGKEYVYEVTPIRENNGGTIPGVGPERLTVAAVDRAAPRAPTGLTISETGNGALVTWNASDEIDLAGYRLYRNGNRVGAALLEGVSFLDPDYRQGMTYVVTAVDESGNESAGSNR